MKGPSTLVRVRAREARSVSENAFRREIELRPVADARSSGSASSALRVALAGKATPVV